MRRFVNLLVQTAGLAVLSVALMLPAPAITSFQYEQGYEEPVETWTKDWTNAQLGSRNRLSQVGGGVVGQALQVSIPTGSHFGSSLELPLPGLNQAWSSYWLRLPEPFASGAQGKLPGFAGEHYANCGQGGAGSPNQDCWTARMAYTCRTRNNDCAELALAFYLYHPSQTGIYGDWEPLAVRLEYGQWYCVQTYLALNTAGQDDGLMAAWVNGEQVFSRTVDFRSSEDSAQIQGFWFDVYEGGSWVATKDMLFDFDELTISQQFEAHPGCLAENPYEPIEPPKPSQPDLPKPVGSWWEWLMWLLRHWQDL